MNLKTRRFLFLFFLVVFFIVGTYLTLRAQGLILDLKHLRVVKTGGLFLKYSPTDARLYLNGKKPKNASAGLFESGVLIKDLLPGTYSIRVEKDGWSTWEKNLTVKPGFITSASQIQLFPQKFSAEKIAGDGMKNFYLTASGIVLKNKNNNLVFNDLTLRGNGEPLTEPNSKIIITREKNTFFLTDLDTPKTAINLNQLFNSLKQRQLGLPGEVPIKDVIPHPFSLQKVLVLTQTSLYALDFKKLALEILAAVPKIESYSKSNSEVFLWDGENLNTVNLLLKVKSVYPLPGNDLRLLVGESGKIFILDGLGKLYSYNRSAATSTLLTENVKDIVLSPEEKRAALLGIDGSLELFYLHDYQSDIEHKAFTKDTLLSAQAENEIKDLTWLPKSNYLAAIFGGNLWVTETDARDHVNAAAIVEGVEKYFTAGSNLYFLKNGSVFRASL